MFCRNRKGKYDKFHHILHVFHGIFLIKKESRNRIIFFLNKKVRNKNRRDFVSDEFSCILTVT